MASQREQYLMDLLGFSTVEELTAWMNKPERPTGNIVPPDRFYEDMQKYIEEEERIYRNRQ